MAYNACAIQSIRSPNDNSCLMLSKNDTTASGEVQIDFTPTADTTELTFADGDGTGTCVVSYIKKPSAGFLNDRFTEEDNSAASSNVVTPSVPVLLWGYAGQAVEEEATTERMVPHDQAGGSGEAALDLIAITTPLDYNSANSGNLTFVYGRPWEVQGGELLEVRAGHISYRINRS